MVIILPDGLYFPSEAPIAASSSELLPVLLSLSLSEILLLQHI